MVLNYGIYERKEKKKERPRTVTIPMPASLAFWMARSTANFPTTGPTQRQNSRNDYKSHISQFIYFISVFGLGGRGD